CPALDPPEWENLAGAWRRPLQQMLETASTARHAVESIVVVDPLLLRRDARRGLRPVARAGRRRDAAARRHRLLLIHAVVGVEHRAAAVRRVRRVLPQARHDAIDIGNRRAAEPPHIRRAGHLLLPCSLVRLRAQRARHQHGAERQREAQDNQLCPHEQILPRFLIDVPQREPRRSSINAASEGCYRTTKCEAVSLLPPCAIPPCRSSSLPRSAARCPQRRISKTPAHPNRPPDCRRSRTSSSLPAPSRPA